MGYFCATEFKGKKYFESHYNIYCYFLFSILCVSAFMCYFGLQNFVANQRLEDLTWTDTESCKTFASAHNDGSYIIWNIDDPSTPESYANIPYGPFPCKRLEKIRFWKNSNGDQMVVFSGGMPRASYGDHYTVTVKAEGKVNLSLKLF